VRDGLRRARAAPPLFDISNRSENIRNDASIGLLGENVVLEIQARVDQLPNGPGRNPPPSMRSVDLLIDNKGLHGC
jgi:hypothetical protein